MWSYLSMLRPPERKECSLVEFSTFPIEGDGHAMLRLDRVGPLGRKSSGTS